MPLLPNEDSSQLLIFDNMPMREAPPVQSWVPASTLRTVQPPQQMKVAPALLDQYSAFAYYEQARAPLTFTRKGTAIYPYQYSFGAETRGFLRNTGFSGLQGFGWSPNLYNAMKLNQPPDMGGSYGGETIEVVACSGGIGGYFTEYDAASGSCKPNWLTIGAAGLIGLMLLSVGKRRR